MTGPIILELGGIDPQGREPDSWELVGGKAFHLAALMRADFPVPPGFVVTTHGHHLGSVAAVRGAAAEAYRQLGSGAVAVRSSATAEDLPDASFAGLQETYLNVEGEEEVWEAVQRCWASAQTERARAYRRRQGIPDGQGRMAVLVQRMVPADIAGVLFSRDPRGCSGMLLEAVRGLGDGLVAGTANPERWSLDSESGDVLEHTPADGIPVELAAEARAELVGWAKRARALFGAEQDLEWAIVGGSVFILQSRSVTSTADDGERVRREEIARLRERAEPEGTVWARYSLAEVLPAPLPLTWSLWRSFMSGGGGYGAMYRSLGYDPDPCLDHDGVLDLVAGRPFFNLSRDARLYFRDFPFEYPFAALKADPERAIYPTPEPNLARAPKGFLLKALGVTLKMVRSQQTLDRAAQEISGRLRAGCYAEMEAWAAGALPVDPSAAGLLTHLDEARERIFGQFLPQALQPSLLAGLTLSKLRAALPPGGPSVEALLRGTRPPREHDLGLAIRHLAGGEISAAGFLAQFGHRGPDEMELARPRWSELGVPQVGMVAPAPSIEAVAGPAGESVGDRRVGELVEQARGLTALRESSKHYLMLGTARLRQLLLLFGAVTGLGDEVFWLEWDELAGVVAGREFRALTAERRRRRSLLLGLPVPRVVFSDDLEALGREPSRDPGEELAQEVSQGVGVSTGIGEGRALVLLDPGDAPAEEHDFEHGFEHGFILVCPSTDPGWVPLFTRARGLVMETGGVLSHGAIVAREFGLPAVVNIPDACTRYATGERLSVDGASGRVHRLRHPGP